MTDRRSPLPDSLPPRGLSRVLAAAYLGISPTKLDELVAAGALPRPLSFGRRVVFDRSALDRRLDELSGLAEAGKETAKKPSSKAAWMEAIHAG